MARNRDYRKELEQRNAKARELGFENYRTLRKALESGKVQRGNEGIEFTTSRSTSREPGYRRAGWNTPQEYTAMQKANREWQQKHSHSIRSELPRGASPEMQRRYYNTYVLDKNPDRLIDIREWNIDLGFMTPAQFDRKYFKK